MPRVSWFLNLDDARELTASGQQCSFVDIAVDYDTLVFFPSIFSSRGTTLRCASGQFLDSRCGIKFGFIEASGILGPNGAGCFSERIKNKTIVRLNGVP